MEPTRSVSLIILTKLALFVIHIELIKFAFLILYFVFMRLTLLVFFFCNTH